MSHKYTLVLCTSQPVAPETLQRVLEHSTAGEALAEGLKVDRARLVLTEPDLLQAARVLLSNLVDRGEWGPDDRETEGCALDKDGDPWYPDVWALAQAVDSGDRVE